jgi:hypothetical protein
MTHGDSVLAPGMPEIWLGINFSQPVKKRRKIIDLFKSTDT